MGLWVETEGIRKRKASFLLKIEIEDNYKMMKAGNSLFEKESCNNNGFQFGGEECLPMNSKDDQF